MRRPPVQSVIERRLLVNYRVEPDIVARLLPRPLSPLVVNGWAVAGICMIRLGQVRPGPIPAALGLRSENAAHRIAVEWHGPDGLQTGVYIPRRDSGSVLNVLAGGRLFPGAHHLARFRVHESATEVRVAYASRDGQSRVSAHVRTVGDLRGSALFATMAQASEFFLAGSVGLSPAHGEARLQGIRLEPSSWHLEPAELVTLRSRYFDDRQLFPAGTAVPDCALLMRDVSVTWRPAAGLQLTTAQPATAC